MEPGCQRVEPRDTKGTYRQICRSVALGPGCQRVEPRDTCFPQKMRSSPCSLRTHSSLKKYCFSAFFLKILITCTRLKYQEYFLGNNSTVLGEFLQDEFFLSKTSKLWSKIEQINLTKH